MPKLPDSLKCQFEYLGEVTLLRPTEDQVIAYQEAIVHLANRQAPLDPLKTGREVLLDLVDPPERRDAVEAHLDDYPGDQDVLTDAFQRFSPPLELSDRTSDDDRRQKRVRVAVGYVKRAEFDGRNGPGVVAPGLDDAVLSFVDETGAVVPYAVEGVEGGEAASAFVVSPTGIRQVGAGDLTTKRFVVTYGERFECVMRRFDGRDWPVLQRAATNNWGFIPDHLLVEHAMKRVQTPDASTLDDYRQKWPHLAWVLARILHAAARPSRLGPK